MYSRITNVTKLRPQENLARLQGNAARALNQIALTSTGTRTQIAGTQKNAIRNKTRTNYSAKNMRSSSYKILFCRNFDALTI
jgi:hypothetical protein